MNEEAVEPQQEDRIDQIMDQASPEEMIEQQIEKEEKTTMVPLSALQKVREKKRELELELQWERQRNAQQQSVQTPSEEDNSRYESATKYDLQQTQQEAIRAIEEKLWIKQNPEKFEKINEYLPTFLKQRPNLASAISAASNRYEEAYTLMDALTPKQQKQLVKESSPKKEAPLAPSSIPRGAPLSDAVDVMQMSDAEFSEWRKSQRRSR